MQRSVAKFRGQLPSPKGLEELQQKSPELFNSGYFLLAAIAGAPPASSNAAGFAVNVTKGGNAGQIVVVSRYRSNDGQTAALGRPPRPDRPPLRRAQPPPGRRRRTGGQPGRLRSARPRTGCRGWSSALALAIALTLGAGPAGGRAADRGGALRRAHGRSHIRSHDAPVRGPPSRPRRPRLSRPDVDRGHLRCHLRNLARLPRGPARTHPRRVPRRCGRWTMRWTSPCAAPPPPARARAC